MQGAVQGVVIQTLRRLIWDQSPNILFLSETKISPQVPAALNRLGFFLMTQVAAFGSSGGLVLSWCPGVVLECFTSNKNNILAWCYSDPQSLWILSCVYSPPKRSDRIDFWDSFAAIGEGFETSWLCIGDFNFVLD